MLFQDLTSGHIVFCLLTPRYTSATQISIHLSAANATKDNQRQLTVNDSDGVKWRKRRVFFDGQQFIKFMKMHSKIYNSDWNKMLMNSVFYFSEWIICDTNNFIKFILRQRQQISQIQIRQIMTTFFINDRPIIGSDTT